jgi:vitamin K-dependent gamma-carboxylase
VVRELAQHERSVSARGFRALSRPVDGAWLAAFRILYGVTLCISMLRFIGYGWVDRLFVAPSFHFKYWGFGWVAPLPGPYMHALFWALAGLALAIALGLWFRWAALAFALGLSYVQLIDVSTYLNHYYLAALLAWLLAASPAARLWSLDAWRLRTRSLRSGVDPRAGQVAAGWLYLFRFQVGLVYVFAGLAKAQSDWLVYAQPLRIWLGAKTELPVLGPLLTIDGVPLLMSWAGFLFDTTIVLWLSFARTRRFAYAVLVVFHIVTRVLLPIGMFPVIMTASALVFFPPSWPRPWVSRLRSWVGGRDAGLRLALEPACNEVLPPASRSGKLGALLGIGYCLVQLALPLRFLAYGGNVLWHEQGMRLSWRVMLRAKGGNTTFLVRDTRTGRRWEINPREYLTEMQQSEMSSQPDLIAQLARHIHRDLEQRGLGPVEVRADARASLNGRRSQPLLDARVDLASVDDSPWPANWVLPAPSKPPPKTRPVL